MMDAVKLDDKLAVEKTVHGWHIFAYFEEDGEIDKYPHAGSVGLSDAGYQKLIDQYCGEDGSGCDLVGDLRNDLDRAVDVVATIKQYSITNQWDDLLPMLNDVLQTAGRL